MGSELSVEFNINSNLFNSISGLIKEPFLVIDQTGNILSFNNEAGELFNIDLNSKNLFDLLDETSSEKFLASIEKILISSSSVSGQISINDNAYHRKTTYHINKYKEGNENILFCIFKQGITQPIPKVESVNVISSDNMLDSSIKELLSYISSEVPFTLTGIEKIKKKLNKTESIAWIENSEGNYLLISKKFAQQFNYKNIRVEGEPVTNFILPTVHSMWNGINEVILKNSSAVQLNHISFNGVSISENEECLKIPVQNSDKKIYAILGIIRQKKVVQPTEKQTDQEDLFKEAYNQILLQMPYPSIIIEKDIIKFYNSSFRDSFLDGLSSSEELKLNRVLSAEFMEVIKNFSNGLDLYLELNISGEKLGGQSKNDRFTVYLNKIISNNLVKGIFLMLEKESYTDDLGIVIGRRGRMFDILLEKNPEPVFIYDTENLRFLDVNEPALRLYGYSKDEFLQMDLTDLYTPEDIQTLLDSTVSKEHFGKFIGPFRHRKKDGSSLLVEISKVNFKFNEKDSHFNTIRDITEKLDLQNKNLIYKSVFENSKSLVFLTDSTGFITYANKESFARLDPSKNKLINSSFTSFVKDEERGRVNSTIFQAGNLSPIQLEASLKSGDNLFLPVAIEATPIQDYKGNIDSFVITATFEIQTEVREVIKEVPAGQSSDLTGPDVDKNMLSGIFHEILTPINVIIGFIQEFSENPNSLTEEQKEAIDIINQNRKTLLNSMNTIVEFIDLEKNKYHLDINQISITELVDSIQKELEIISRDGIDLAYGRISSSLKFENDKAKILQLFTQLIKAISHLNHGRKVYFSAYQLDDDKFAVSVKDAYSTISPELFNPIYSIFSNDQSGKDYGLSKLSIKLMKKMLSLLHGEFRLLSKGKEKPDYGFVFSQKFESEFIADPILDEVPAPEVIPVSKAVPKTPKSKTPEQFENRSGSEGFEEVPSSKVLLHKYDFNNMFEEPKEEALEDIFAEEIIEEEDQKVYEDSVKTRNTKKINLHEYSCLYIEDQTDSQILFKVQMKELKDLKFAVSFEEALPLLDNYNFDFIVMDINLQGEYNGLDALKIIHKMPKFEKIPIIAVTAYVLPGDKEKFIATGFNDFISKPIFREKIIGALEGIFLKGI